MKEDFFMILLFAFATIGLFVTLIVICGGCYIYCCCTTITNELNEPSQTDRAGEQVPRRMHYEININ